MVFLILVMAKRKNNKKSIKIIIDIVSNELESLISLLILEKEDSRAKE